MRNEMNNFEHNNGDGQQYPAEQPADERLPDIMKSTVSTQPTNTAITETSLTNNQSISKGKPPKVVEKDNQLACDGDEESIRQTFGTADPNLLAHLMLQVQLASPTPLRGLGEDRNSSLAALHGIAPRDTLEGMLSAQMLAVHDNAMDSLRKANQHGQPDHVVDAHRSRGIKLMNTFCMQMKTLSEHRNNLTQSMVQEVHVHHGAQAIVGAIGMQQTRTEKEDTYEKPYGPSAQKGLAKKRKHSR